MRLNPYKGVFVAIEGLDGSGSDQVACDLVKSLAKKELPAVFVKEPSVSPAGRFVRNLLRERQDQVAPLTLEFLFAADRALQVEERITPALKEGKIVVADRFLWSSIAYRSLHFPFHWLLAVNERFYLPDCSFFINVEPEVCAARIEKNADEIRLYEKADKLAKVKEGYEMIWRRFGYCFDFVGGDKQPAALVEIIQEAVLANFKF